MTDDDANPNPDSRPASVRVTAAKCVRCAKPVTPRYRPFCSQRCADIDLGEWLKGSYRVPTNEQPEVSEPPAQNRDPDET